jgi:hypothetical protein
MEILITKPKERIKMKVKKVNRYYCEYCKKSSCSGGHMQKHELHCTANPRRVCRMCQRNEDCSQLSIDELMDILPDDSLFVAIGKPWNGAGENAQYEKNALSRETLQIAADSLKKLREKTNGCPACILAAIKQKGGLFFKNFIYDFDYAKESKEWLDSYYSDDCD